MVKLTNFKRSLPRNGQFFPVRDTQNRKRVLLLHFCNNSFFIEKLSCYQFIQEGCYLYN